MISFTRDGAIAVIALARPEARNALPTAAWRALAAAARVVALRSDVPGIFSVDADVREFERLQADPELRTEFREAMRAGLVRLKAQVGKGMASMLLFTGDKLRADEAHKIGPVALKVRKGRETADALASAIAGNAPNALRQLKRALAGPSDVSLDAAFGDAFGGSEFAEGPASFRERRNPDHR